MTTTEYIGPDFCEVKAHRLDVFSNEDNIGFIFYQYANNETVVVTQYEYTGEWDHEQGIKVMELALLDFVRKSKPECSHALWLEGSNIWQ